MKRETQTAEKPSDLKTPARKILAALRRARPGARIELEFTTPLELLVATILSAQCTDARTNPVTRSLFRKYRTARDYAEARRPALEKAIRPTGFYHNKAKALLALGRKLLSDHGGQVPDTMEALVALPGVARKTANVLLGNAFGKAEGIVVDTHVLRVAQRLGLSKQKQPEKIERDLMAVFPRQAWIEASTQLVLHGRYICLARAPKCSACPVNKLCPKIGVTPL
jgi:endonuclease-3